MVTIDNLNINKCVLNFGDILNIFQSIESLDVLNLSQNTFDFNMKR